MKPLTKRMYLAFTLVTFVMFSSVLFAQSFQGLGDLPGGTVSSRATDVSADGKVVVGSSYYGGNYSLTYQAFRWTTNSGMVGLGFLPGGGLSVAEAASADGSVIVGASTSTAANGQTEAFRWVAPGPMVGLGDLPGGQFSSGANGVAAGGGVIAGMGDSGNPEAFLWLFAFGMTGLNYFPNGNSSVAYDIWSQGGNGILVGSSSRDCGPTIPGGCKNILEAFYFNSPGPMASLGFLSYAYTQESEALAISGDGKVIVGYSSGGGVGSTEAFRYVLPNGPMTGLGTLGHLSSKALDVSGDGSIVVGWSDTGGLTDPQVASIWDATNGMRDLKNVLVNSFGLNLTGWQLAEASGISDDGMTIVGNGRNPSGNQEAWIANLAVGSLTLVSPNGGEVWQAGTQHEIKWTSTNFNKNVRLWLSYGGYAPQAWVAVDLMQSTPNDGSYMWTVPNNPSTNCVMKVADAADGNPWDASDAPFTITAPAQSLTVTSPNGGEKWQVGSSHNITWSSQNLSNPVKIAYSINNGASYTTIVSSTLNDGSFNWTVPNKPSTNCLVRVSDATDGNPSDVSDAKFEIVAGASITVTSPNGGETWQVGSSHSITWSSQNLSNPVKIEYSTNGGSSYKTVVSSTSNDGSHPWTIPNKPSVNCLVRISDATDGNPWDVSDAKFEIVAGASITVTSPNGGETWAVGSQQEIKWTSANFTAPVRIDFLSNNTNSTFWTNIVANTPNDGSFMWNLKASDFLASVPLQGKIRVADATKNDPDATDDGKVSDWSDAPFTINLAQNTPTGKNVEVDVGNGVKVTFENVTSPGETTLDVKTSGPPPPSGFKIMPSGLPVYFDIKTSAGFSGNITICIPYNDTGMTPTEEAKLRLHVYEVPPGKWKDITKLPVDTANNIICGSINHLTVFAMMLGPVHFNFASNTGESYSIVVDNVTLDAAQLTNGDEIGVFTPTGLCVGAAVWDGTTPLALTAWADDSQTNGVDGYQSGEKMSFRIWDAGAGTQDDYPATATYSAGNGNFGDGAFAHISLLEAVTSVTQALSLPQGWSWLSLNVEPQNRSMESVMTGVANLVIVVNNAGQFYIPNVINSIGNWSILEGYKIYVSAPDQVSVTGKPVTATTPIALKSGWNFVSYLPATAMSAETALASVLAQLAIIKNDAGKFFIPNVINSLGNMTPGEGYKLYLNADATLTYPQGSSPAKGHSARLAKQNVNTSHFVFTQRTGDSFSIIVKSNGQAFKAGDEIGIFTPGGLCVGAGVCDGSGILGISAWADDDRTDVVDGFRVGEKMRFKLWDANKNREATLEAIVTSGSERFDDAPFTVVELASPTVPTTFSLGQNYPNPFNAGTVISYQLPASGKVTLTVYNLLGEQVRLLLNEQQDAGAYSMHWDGKNQVGRFVPSGVYLYRIQAGRYSAVRKAVFVK